VQCTLASGNRGAEAAATHGAALAAPIQPRAAAGALNDRAWPPEVRAALAVSGRKARRRCCSTPRRRATKAAGNDGTQLQLWLPSRSAGHRSTVLNGRLIRAGERVPADGTGNCGNNTGPVRPQAPYESSSHVQRFPRDASMGSGFCLEYGSPPLRGVTARPQWFARSFNLSRAGI
jgi:hypothetical protein